MSRRQDPAPADQRPAAEMKACLPLQGHQVLEGMRRHDVTPDDSLEAALAICRAKARLSAGANWQSHAWTVAASHPRDSGALCICTDPGVASCSWADQSVVPRRLLVRLYFEGTGALEPNNL